MVKGGETDKEFLLFKLKNEKQTHMLLGKKVYFKKAVVVDKESRVLGFCEMPEKIGLDFVFSEHFNCEEFGLTLAQYKKKCEVEHPYYHVLKWRSIVKYDKPYDVLSKPVRGSRYSTHEEVTVLNQLMTEWLIKQHPGYGTIFEDNSELIMELTDGDLGSTFNRLQSGELKPLMVDEKEEEDEVEKKMKMSKMQVKISEEDKKKLEIPVWNECCNILSKYFKTKLDEDILTVYHESYEETRLISTIVGTEFYKQYFQVYVSPRYSLFSPMELKVEVKT